MLQKYIMNDASIIPQTILDMIDKTLRDIFESRMLFAGKNFIFEWDFDKDRDDKISLIVTDDDTTLSILL